MSPGWLIHRIVFTLEEEQRMLGSHIHLVSTGLDLIVNQCAVRDEALCNRLGRCGRRGWSKGHPLFCLFGLSATAGDVHGFQFKEGCFVYVRSLFHLVWIREDIGVNPDIGMWLDLKVVANRKPFSPFVSSVHVWVKEVLTFFQVMGLLFALSGFVPPLFCDFLLLWLFV